MPHPSPIEADFTFPIVVPPRVLPDYPSEEVADVARAVLRILQSTTSAVTFKHLLDNVDATAVRIDEALEALKSRELAAGSGDIWMSVDPFAGDALSGRARRFVAAWDIVEPSDLTTWTEGAILRTPDVGRRTLNELQDVLARRSMRFADAQTVEKTRPVAPSVDESEVERWAERIISAVPHIALDGRKIRVIKNAAVVIVRSTSATGRELHELDRQILGAWGMPPAAMEVVGEYLRAIGGRLPDVRWQRHVDIEDLARTLVAELEGENGKMVEPYDRDVMRALVRRALENHGSPARSACQ